MKALWISCALAWLGIFVLGCGRSTPNSPSSHTTPSPTAAVGPALTIRASDSPTDGDSREPDLYATQDGRIILSWVEKIGAKRYALRTAARDASGWSDARIVAEGENWFVNWADFPSVIALQD
ncbi:MAG: hypothetical protein ACRD8U_23645, partial [Pyrinomonadaceae bacterium]